MISRRHKIQSAKSTKDCLQARFLYSKLCLTHQILRLEACFEEDLPVHKVVVGDGAGRVRAGVDLEREDDALGAAVLKVDGEGGGGQGADNELDQKIFDWR